MDGANIVTGTTISIQRGLSKTVRVFVNYGDLVEIVEDNGSGITRSLGAKASGGFTPCNTFIDVNISTAATALLQNNVTITLFGKPAGIKSKTCSFRINIVPNPDDCDTPERILALMVGAVVVGNPTDVDDTRATTLGVSFSSELFHVAQASAALNTNCDANLSLFIYSAASSAALSNLPNLAATNDNFALPAGVSRVSCTKSRSNNTLSCSGTVARGAITAGTTVFYRVAKRITKNDDIDPIMFSTTYSFVVTELPNVLPTANAGVDRTVTLPATTTTLTGSGTDTDGTIVSYLWTRSAGAAQAVIAVPTAATTSISGLAAGTYTFSLRVTDNRGGTATNSTVVTVVAALPDLRPEGTPSQPLYGGRNGTVGDGTFSYYKLSDNFCTSLPDLGSYTQDGSLGAAFSSTADKRIMKLSHLLPSMDIFYKNYGTASTGAGFQVQVLKGTTNTALATLTANTLAAGALSQVTYSTRGTAIVYRFPGFDGTADARFCYVREELNHTFPATMENEGVTIKVDSGSVITESNDTNNSKFIAAGTTVVIPR